MIFNLIRYDFRSYCPKILSRQNKFAIPLPF